MRILIAILGCHTRPTFRQAQRDTWLKDLRGADYRFFLGRPVLADGPADEVYLDVEDTYEKLSYKTRGLMQWAHARNYDWVFKCDDDTFVRPARLLASNFAQDGYSGFTDGRWHDTGPIVFGFAQGGAGYWVGRREIGILAEHFEVREYCEDLATGLTLAKHGINPVHDVRYQPQIGPRELEYAEVRRNWLTMHKCNPDQMHYLYASDQKEAEQCAFA